MYVGPTSTDKEKLLKMRANIMNNSTGMKVHGKDL